MNSSQNYGFSFTLTLFLLHLRSWWVFNYFVYDRSDPCLDFIAVYNATNQQPHAVSLLQRTGADEIVSEEPLATVAALEIQSTRASMSIEGKMLSGSTFFLHFVTALLFL